MELATGILTSHVMLTNISWSVGQHSESGDEVFVGFCSVKWFSRLGMFQKSIFDLLILFLTLCFCVVLLDVSMAIMYYCKAQTDESLNDKS